MSYIYFKPIIKLTATLFPSLIAALASPSATETSRDSRVASNDRRVSALINFTRASSNSETGFTFLFGSAENKKNICILYFYIHACNSHKAG